MTSDPERADPNGESPTGRMSRRTWLATAATLAGTAMTTTGSVSGTRTSAAEPESEAAEVWDNHVHLGPFAGTTPEEKADDLLKYADRMGISRLVLFMGWPLIISPTPEEIRHQNDQVLAALARAPDRLLGYVYVNPADVPGSLDEIRRCVVDGPMVGLKLWVAEHCDQKNLDPIIELATELNAAIYQHTWIKTGGNLENESTPVELAALAKRHPQARLICGHAGGNWELGIRAIQDSPSLVLEIAGSDPTAGMTEMAVRDLTANRVIFGSDAGGRSLGSQLAKVAGADIPEDAKSRILGTNLREMLRPILRSKGMAE